MMSGRRPRMLTRYRERKMTGSSPKEDQRVEAKSLRVSCCAHTAGIAVAVGGTEDEGAAAAAADTERDAEDTGMGAVTAIRERDAMYVAFLLLLVLLLL